MTTFTSALSLLVLLLATGCFTLPIIQEKFSDSTISPFHDFTTSKTNENKVVSFHMRLVPDDETSDLPELPEERSLTNDWNIRTSTFANIPTPKDNSVRRPRTFDDLHSSEPFTFTTEHSFHERDEHDFIFHNAELNTEATEHERRSVTIEPETEPETESEGENDKRDFLELTTSYLPSFTSTSSDVAPKFYTSEPSTQKYIGHLQNELEEVEKVKGSKKITKSEVYPEEDSKEVHFPQAQLDQKALDSTYNVPSYVMHLEHNNEVVTDIPERFLTTTILNEKEEERQDKPELKPNFERKDKFEAKRDDKDETKLDDKDETKRDDKDETKREDKDETKREDKDETKREDKDETKREDRREEEPKHVPKEHRLLNQGKEPLFHEETKPDF
jgi:hypothetical protein